MIQTLGDTNIRDQSNRWPCFNTSHKVCVRQGLMRYRGRWMYWERASFPGHGLLPLTCVSIESWWTGGTRALLGMDQNAGEMDSTDCTSVESHSGCCTSVRKREWVYEVCGSDIQKKSGSQPFQLNVAPKQSLINSSTPPPTPPITVYSKYLHANLFQTACLAISHIKLLYVTRFNCLCITFS